MLKESETPEPGGKLGIRLVAIQIAGKNSLSLRQA
jgi:hypothetical protein